MGRRWFEIYSRPDSPGEDGGSWTRHAGGVLVRGEPARERVEESWPPVGSESVDIDGLYDALEEQGLEYGPAFQGLRAAWLRGDGLLRGGRVGARAAG